MQKTIVWFSIILLCGCAYLSYVKDPFVDTPHFYKVNDTLYRGGQPSEKGLNKLQSLGIKAIVSLRGDDEETLIEKREAGARGMDFYSIPMSVYKRPTDKQVLTFLEVILATENQPVFVHCESGRDKTGAMIALYRVVVQGWGPKEAYKEAKQYGFWPYRGEAELKNFIHQLKDKPIYFEKARFLINQKSDDYTD